MKLTLVLLLVLGLTLCLAKDLHKPRKDHPLLNKTDGNGTHPEHPKKRGHSLHHKQNEANVTALTEEENTPATETETEAEVNEEASVAEEASRLLAGKKNVHHFGRPQRNAPHKGGKRLRGYHHKPAAPAVNNTGSDNSDNSDDENTDNDSEAQVSEEAVVAEQGEDAEDVARLLAEKKVRKNKKVAPRRGHKKHARPHKRPVKPEEVTENTENAEAVTGEDAEDIEHELRRLAGQIQGSKKHGHPIKKGGKKSQRKPEVKPELKPEDFDLDYHFFGEHAFENGEAFDFDHHHPKY